MISRGSPEGEPFFGDFICTETVMIVYFADFVYFSFSENI